MKTHVYVMDMESEEGLKRTGIKICAIQKIGVLEKRIFTRKEGKVEFFNDFIDWVESKREKRLLIFSYNLGFDFLVFYGLNIDSIQFRRSNVIAVKIKLGKKEIELRDFANYTAHLSLQTLANTFLNKSKVEITDWDTVGWDLLMKRVEEDTKILGELIVVFHDIFLKRFGVNLFEVYTISGLAYKILENYFIPQTYKNPFRVYDYGVVRKYKHVEEIIKKGYCGGRVENFTFYGEDIYEYDFNSLYPYVMSTCKFPNKYLGYVEIKSVDDLKKYVDRFEGYFSGEIEIYEHFIPIIPKKNGRLIFPIGKFETVVAFPELRVALEFQQIKDIRGILFLFDGFEFNREKIMNVYRMRQENEAMKVIAKLILNSCYGHFGLKSEREVWIYKDGAVEIKKEEVIMMRQNYAIASYITSQARSLLSRVLNTLYWNGFEVYYTDTDSIFTNATPEDMLRLNIKIGKDIGQLKYEGHYTFGIFVAPKLYALIGQRQKYKAKGLWEAERNLWEFLRGQMLIKQEYTRVKTLLKTGQPAHDVKRSYHFEYTKRLISPIEFKTYPFENGEIIIQDTHDILNRVFNHIKNRLFKVEVFKLCGE